MVLVWWHIRKSCHLWHITAPKLQLQLQSQLLPKSCSLLTNLERTGRWPNYLRFCHRSGWTSALPSLEWCCYLWSEPVNGRSVSSSVIPCLPTNKSVFLLKWDGVSLDQSGWSDHVRKSEIGSSPAQCPPNHPLLLLLCSFLAWRLVAPEHVSPFLKLENPGSSSQPQSPDPVPLTRPCDSPTKVISTLLYSHCWHLHNLIISALRSIC